MMSMKEGKGVESFGNGDVYNGQYSRDKFHGQGELLTKGGRYRGNFSEGYKDGLGTMNFKNGHRYEGIWVQGRFQGRGLYIWEDGKKYEGEWVKGQRHGPGVTTLPNGERHGKSIIYCSNLRSIIGGWATQMAITIATRSMDLVGGVSQTEKSAPGSGRMMCW